MKTGTLCHQTIKHNCVSHPRENNRGAYRLKSVRSLRYFSLPHHLGLQFLRREGFLLRPYVQSHAAKFSFQFGIARCRCQCRLGTHTRFLVVIVVITLVEKHKRDVVLGI